MKKLHRNALASLPMTEPEVDVMYSVRHSDLPAKRLCESHERLRIELDGVEIMRGLLDAELAAAIGLLNELTDDSECMYDHHGYCQAHSLHSNPCPHEVAKKMLGKNKRCDKCGWPLVKSTAEGCTAGNCSQRNGR